MTNNNLNKVYEDAIAEIEKKVSDFKAKLDEGTADPEKFITLSEIESLWASLNKSTTKTYSDMISAYLTDLDEKAVIQLKKGSTGSMESG